MKLSFHVLLKPSVYKGFGTRNFKNAWKSSKINELQIYEKLIAEKPWYIRVSELKTWKNANLLNSWNPNFIGEINLVDSIESNFPNKLKLNREIKYGWLAAYPWDFIPINHCWHRIYLIDLIPCSVR